MRQVKYNWWTLNVMEKWETLNPKWRPKKGISFVNAELAKKWYNPAEKQDIEATYMSMVQLEEQELVKMWKDKTKPMLVRILAKNMLSWKWFEIIEKILDRWIWKPKQSQDTTIKWNLTLTDWLIEVTKNKQKEEF